MKSAELLIIVAVVLLLFGSKKLPDLARRVGRTAKEFRSGIQHPSGAADTNASEKDAGG